MAANSGMGIGYIYSNVSYYAPNLGNAAYIYSNVGYDTQNTQIGCGYSYENVTIYVINNSNMLPPIIT